MPDSAYTDPRIAAIYDILNPAAEDTAFYLRLAGQTPQRVLDMGCGTGHLAEALARQGHRVVGADPAKAMLDVARRKPNAEQVTWVESDTAGLNLDTRFDLITMTGHVFQVFLSDEAVHEALLNLKRHLAENGRLTFETRNPAYRAWEKWTPDQTTEQALIPEIGPITIYYDVQTVTDKLVTFNTHIHFANEEVVIVPSTLRFMNQAELVKHLQQAGFTQMQWFGNWDSSPLQSDSPEIIVVAN
jgi:ubiquinone/menaquinone biosynthesis C-methylase UbiE